MRTPPARIVPLALAGLAAFLLAPRAPAQAPCELFHGPELPAGTAFDRLVAFDVDRDGDLDLVGVEFSPSVARLGVLAQTAPRSFLPAAFDAAYAGVNDLATGDLDGDGVLDLIAAVGANGTPRVVVLRSSTSGVQVVSTYPVPGGNPARLALADFDHDGDLDVAFVDWQQTFVRVLQNHGTGQLALVASFPSMGGTPSLGSGDLDGDGWADLSLAGGTFQANLVRIENHGAWSFTTDVEYVFAGGAFDQRVADVDGDGRAERILIEGTTSASQLTVVHRANQVTTTVFLPTERLATSLAVADLDQDGDLELVHNGSATSGSIGVFRHTAPGAFTSAPALATAPSSRAVCAADLDGDGHVDLAVSCYAGADSKLTVRFGVGPGTFDDPAGIDASATVERVAAGDVDHDGVLDLVASTPGAIAFARGVGAGVFAPLVTTPTTLAGALELVDLDGDLDLDLVQGDPFVAQANVFSFASGTFAAPIPMASGVAMEVLRHADLDLDGDQDVVGVDIGNFQVAVFQNAAGVLAPPVALPLAQRASSLALADLDGDGLVDVVAGSRGTSGVNQVVRLRNLGGLVFAGPVAIDTAQILSVLEVATADFDGDGDADVAWSDTFSGTTSLHVLANAGGGAFTTVQTFTGSANSGRLVATQLDGDGAPDLAVVQAGCLTPFLNDGAGHFTPQSVVCNGSDPRELAFADVNGDRRTDVVVANGGSNRIEWWENVGACSVGTSFCAGDGSATPCPCGNAGASGHGCDNSLGNGGGRLAARGQALVSNDTLTLDATNLPGATLLLYFQGTSVENGGAGTVLGDGLLCASGSLIRIAARNASAGARSFGFGVAGDLPLSVRGQLPPAGGARAYQVWYRNAAAFCTGATYNLTNGLSIVWGL